LWWYDTFFVARPAMRNATGCVVVVLESSAIVAAPEAPHVS
jgi:hypothetical protein